MTRIFKAAQLFKNPRPLSASKR